MKRTTTAIAVITACIISQGVATAQSNRRQPPLDENRRCPQPVIRQNERPVEAPRKKHGSDVTPPSVKAHKTDKNNDCKLQGKVQSVNPQSGVITIIDNTGARIAVPQNAINSHYRNYNRRDFDHYNKRRKHKDCDIRPKFYGSIDLGFRDYQTGDYFGINIASDGTVSLEASIFRLFR